MKIYRSITVVLLGIMVFSVGAQAQGSKADLRTNETKIADIAMQLPAASTQQFNLLMEELSQLDKPIVSLSSLLAEPGVGDDSAVRYAIAGLSFYVGKTAYSSQKTQLALSFCEAIEQTKSEEIKDFLLIQLQYVVGNESLPTLSKCLGVQRLSDAAARALVRINTEQSNQLLLSQLQGASTTPLQVVLLGALGQTAYAPALATLTGFTKSTNPKLNKAAGYALAEIASLSSLKVLEKAAYAANLQLNEADAPGNYLLYLMNLEKKGHTKEVEKAAEQLFKRANDTEQIAVKMAGFNFILKNNPSKVATLFKQALASKNPVFRDDVVRAICLTGKEDLIDLVLQKVSASREASFTKALLLNLGATQNPKALSFIKQSLQSTKPEVVTAAIQAYSHLPKEDLTPVIAAMNSSDKALLGAAKQTLTTNQNSKSLALAVQALDKLPDEAKAVVIAVVGERRETQYTNTIMELAASKQEAVASASKQALVYLVDKKEVDKLVQLINSNTNPKDLPALQEALYEAIKGTGRTTKQTDKVLEIMAKNPDKEGVYYAVLAKIGTKAGLDKVVEAYQNKQNKEEAFKALVNWKNADAAPYLYEIAQNDANKKEGALNSYIKMVAASNYPANQMWFALRKALTSCTTDAQLSNTLKAMGTIYSFPTIVSLVDYFTHNTKAVRQSAIQGILNMVEETTDIAGPAVAEWTYQALELDKSSEAEYQKAAVLKQLKLWPENQGWKALASITELNELYKDRSKNDFELYLERKSAEGADWDVYLLRLVGNKVSVVLNGEPVQNAAEALEYWGSTGALFPLGAAENYRKAYLKEVVRPQAYILSKEEAAEGFVPLFNGIDISGWTGNLRDYVAQNGMIVCDPQFGGRGNLYTEKEYADFVLRFDFLLTPAANNGLGIRTPLEGDAAYVGMELQILDNTADVYKNLKEHQYHGSVYGVIPAKRGALHPVGEWNSQEVIAKGNRITITLNGVVIVDGDIKEASNNFTKTVDGKEHPGLSNPKGHIGFLGHGSYVSFKNLRIKELK